MAIVHADYPEGLGVVIKIAHGWNPQATWYVARAILGVLGSGGTVAQSMWGDARMGIAYNVQVHQPPMSLTSIEALSETATAYYDRYRFAHVFARVERAPEHLPRQMRHGAGAGERITAPPPGDEGLLAIGQRGAAVGEGNRLGELQMPTVRRVQQHAGGDGPRRTRRAAERGA